MYRLTFNDHSLARLRSIDDDRTAELTEDELDRIERSAEPFVLGERYARLVPETAWYVVFICHPSRPGELVVFIDELDPS